MKPFQSTWSPFQSPEVRDICKHLTDDERRRLYANAADFGRQTGWRFALPSGLVAGSFVFSISAGFAMFALLLIYLFCFERNRLQANQQRVRDLLCASQYAQARGYGPDTLRMFAFPWSHVSQPLDHAP